MTTTQTLTKLFSLEGKRGIVTGGSSGLGLAMSRLLAEAGAQVFAFSRSGEVKVELSDPLPANVVQVRADVTDYAQVKTAVDEIGADGGIDFLVNNAGITEKGTAEEFDMESFERIQKVNVDAIFHLCKACFPYLKEAEGAGRIVSISSMAAHLGFSQVVPYSASKAAVTGLTRGLAVEWAGENILVNSVAPGWFPSEMQTQVVDDERQRRILGRMPLHRYGNPQELAAMVLFLVSPAASYITGQDIAVDGGALAYGY